MADTDVIDAADVSDDHLYVGEYGGQQTIALGHDVALWNEGLPEPLTVHRDLGRVVHSWTVTEAGFRELRTEQITSKGNLVLVPGPDSQQEHPIIVENVDPTLRFPDELFSVSQINTVVKSADPDEDDIDAAELDALAEAPRDTVERINRDVESAFEARYEAWVAEADPYPEGRDFGYEIPLSPEWKRRVLAERTDLSEAQVDLLATAGFPASMRVTVDVETPDAVEERLD